MNILCVKMLSHNAVSVRTRLIFQAYAAGSNIFFGSGVCLCALKSILAFHCHSQLVRTRWDVNGHSLGPISLALGSMSLALGPMSLSLGPISLLQAPCHSHDFRIVQYLIWQPFHFKVPQSATAGTRAPSPAALACSCPHLLP